MQKGVRIMQITKQNRKFIISVIMTLMLIASMMPGMAFAQSEVEGYNVEITSAPTSMTTADSTATLTASTTKPEGSTTAVHIDWSSSDTSVATIGKHKGTLTPRGAGTVTITARLVEGAEPSDGGGTGNSPCTGTTLATDTVVVNITEAAYGYQGEGGNTMLMEKLAGADVETGDITVGPMDTYNSKNAYNNTIEDPLTSTDVTVQDISSEPYIPSTINGITFGYTMSAGINNFKVDTFKTYMNDIAVYDAAGTTKVADIKYVGFANRIVTIAVDADNLDENRTYTLRFGPSVCGNNPAKNLNCYVDFEFVYGGNAQ